MIMEIKPKIAMDEDLFLTKVKPTVYDITERNRSTFCFYLVSTLSGEKVEPETYTAEGNEDIGEIVTERLIKYARLIFDACEKQPKPMQLTVEE